MNQTTIVVTKIDRCARNTLEFLKLQDILFKRNIQFISLDLPYSEDLNINKLISTTLSSIAEFETNRRKERQMQGISAAKKAEQYYEQKHDAGYSESHEKAENHWSGPPWTNTEDKK